MTKKHTLTNGVGVAHLDTQKSLTKISGTLTSPIQLREEKTKEPYYYSFIRCKGQKIDLPVIFKTQAEIKLKKGQELELTGHYSNSDKNVRKSFTCSAYQLLNEKRTKKKKECFGCGDNFTCSPFENYDYCTKCELNGSRYIPGRFTKQDCPECGDGQGIVKFPQQPPRNCKTCSYAKQAILAHAKGQLPQLAAQTEKIRQVQQKLTAHA